MSELEEKLGAMLSNPQLMQQISSLVQAWDNRLSLRPLPRPCREPPPQPSEPDLSQLQGLASLLQSNRIDTNQQALLRALSPYLSPWRGRKTGTGYAGVKNGGAGLGVSPWQWTEPRREVRTCTIAIFPSRTVLTAETGCRIPDDDPGMLPARVRRLHRRPDLRLPRPCRLAGIGRQLPSDRKGFCASCFQRILTLRICWWCSFCS